ncbi:unnamed protein product [Closterium sp. NIES-65]|nr:unnamed protein product [Closterium sp. NIES-65]
MPREPREVHHVDDFRRLAAENDSSDVASSRSDDAGDVACDAFTTTSDVEAGGVRVRTVDHNARRETDYVIVVHGTFDAPPADGARTWYQPPAPGEQNFCAKMGALLARGPIGAESVWRAIPRATDSQGAESQGAESQGSEVFRSGSQTGQSQGGAASQKGQSQGGAASQEGGQSWQRMMDGDVPYPFFWDGSNTHEGRVKAAEKHESTSLPTPVYSPICFPSPPHLLPLSAPFASPLRPICFPSPPHLLPLSAPFSSPLRPIFFPSPLEPRPPPPLTQMARLAGTDCSDPSCRSRLKIPPGIFSPSAPSPLVFTTAGAALARLLDLIARRDPSARIHVIAHSHGGNVLLKAIELVSAV